MYAIFNSDLFCGYTEYPDEVPVEFRTYPLPDGYDISSQKTLAINADGECVAIPETIPIDPTAFLIDTGPFFDRFGEAKLPLLMSADPLVKALMTDIQVRKWIDLQRPDVAQALAVLVGKSLITNGLKTAILDTPVATEENRVLKKLYFS